MRSIKSGLLGGLFCALLGVGMVVGCTATGATEDVGEPDASGQPDVKTGSTIPPKSGGDEEDGNDASFSSSGTDGGKDAGKDASIKDAAPDAPKDSGAPTPNPGDPCATIDQIFKKSCGKCGQQEAICKANDGGTGGIVSAYGLCQNEIGQCVPGETAACGNCGTKSCSNSCNWNACLGQPANSCSPGTTQYSSAGCLTPNTFIKKTCGANCQFGTFTNTCESPSLTVPATVNDVSSGTWTLSATQQAKRPEWGLGPATCPATDLSLAVRPYFAVPVTNNTGKAAVVQIYNSGANPLDTILSVYPGSTLPSTDDEIKACTTGADDCESLNDVCGNEANLGSYLDWAGMDDVTIPAGATVMVVTAGYYDDTLGDFTLNVKTKSLQ